jgi:hypothetical protein
MKTPLLAIALTLIAGATWPQTGHWKIHPHISLNKLQRNSIMNVFAVPGQIDPDIHQMLWDAVNQTYEPAGDGVWYTGWHKSGSQQTYDILKKLGPDQWVSHNYQNVYTWASVTNTWADISPLDDSNLTPAHWPPGAVPAHQLYLTQQDIQDISNGTLSRDLAYRLLDSAAAPPQPPVADWYVVYERSDPSQMTLVKAPASGNYTPFNGTLSPGQAYTWAGIRQLYVGWQPVGANMGAVP